MKNGPRNPTWCIWTHFAKKENQERLRGGDELIPDDWSEVSADVH